MTNNKWTKEQENLLAQWRERGACYRWLHEKATKKYKKYHMALTLPVIFISTITGTANFGVGGITNEENLIITKDNIIMIVGTLNLIAGLITTIQNFLKFAELTESHRSSSIQWSKFQRNLSAELALSPIDRDNGYEFIKKSRLEYDRLIEHSSPIPNSIIKEFKCLFKDNIIAKPEDCNGIEKTEIFGREDASIERVSGIMSSAINKLQQNAKSSKKEDEDIELGNKFENIE